MINRIDDIDVKILELLQDQGRIKRNQIAENVGLSVPSVSERMRKLEDKGIIKGFHAVLEPKALSYDVGAFIRVNVDGSNNYPAFLEKCTENVEILETHSITGEGSHILKIRTKNTAGLENLLAQIQTWPGVKGTMTSIVLSTYKESRKIAVEAQEI